MNNSLRNTENSGPEPSAHDQADEEDYRFAQKVYKGVAGLLTFVGIIARVTKQEEMSNIAFIVDAAVVVTCIAGALQHRALETQPDTQEPGAI